jgi:hypothetical protein
MGRLGQELEETGIISMEKLESVVVEEPIDFPVIVSFAVLGDILEGGRAEVGTVVRGWQRLQVKEPAEEFGDRESAPPSKVRIGQCVKNVPACDLRDRSRIVDWHGNQLTLT